MRLLVSGAHTTHYGTEGGVCLDHLAWVTLFHLLDQLQDKLVNNMTVVVVKAMAYRFAQYHAEHTWSWNFSLSVKTLLRQSCNILMSASDLCCLAGSSPNKCMYLMKSKNASFPDIIKKDT